MKGSTVKWQLLLEFQTRDPAGSLRTPHINARDHFTTSWGHPSIIEDIPRNFTPPRFIRRISCRNKSIVDVPQQRPSLSVLFATNSGTISKLIVGKIMGNQFLLKISSEQADANSAHFGVKLLKCLFRRVASAVPTDRNQTPRFCPCPGNLK